MAKLGRKPNNIARYSRAYAHTTGVLCVLLSQVSQKLYNPLCNNHLNRLQKQHPSMSHFHAATPPQKLPQTPSSKQHFQPPTQNNPSLFIKWPVTFHKTTRGFQQNDTSLSIKRYVVLGDDEVFSTPSAVTLVTAKIKTPSTGARIHARVRTPSAYTQPSPHSIKPINPSTAPPFRFPLVKTFTCEEIFISNETTNNKS